MVHFNDIEEIMADSLTLLMDRSNKLNAKDQKAIGEEFREWLKDGLNSDEVLTNKDLLHF
tara:strand:- start:78 stop:257 length:180 start_codon:yes stop_codon:yes gene_type:complete